MRVASELAARAAAIHPARPRKPAFRGRRRVIAVSLPSIEQIADEPSSKRSRWRTRSGDGDTAMPNASRRQRARPTWPTIPGIAQTRHIGSLGSHFGMSKARVLLSWSVRSHWLWYRDDRVVTYALVLGNHLRAQEKD
jgi:hypothetical protein